MISLRLPTSFAVIFGAFTLGFYVAIQGPTLMDLIDLLHVNNDIMSYSLAFASLAYSVGGLLSGFLFNYVNRQILIACFFTVFGLANIATPFISNYYIFSVITVFKMMCAGGTDCGANVWILELWPGQDSWLQALHFSFAIGCALGPLIVEPFLSVDYKESDLNKNLAATGQAIINEQAGESRIYIPYGVSGSSSILAAALILWLYFLDSKQKKQASKLRAKQQAASGEHILMTATQHPAVLEAGGLEAVQMAAAAAAAAAAASTPTTVTPAQPTTTTTVTTSSTSSSSASPVASANPPQVTVVVSVGPPATPAAQSVPPTQRSSSPQQQQPVSPSSSPSSRPQTPQQQQHPPQRATGPTQSTTQQQQQQQLARQQSIQQIQQQQQQQQANQQQPNQLKITSKAKEQLVGRPPYYVMFAIALAALCLSFYCGIEITSMNYLATFAVNIDLQLPKSTAALMSSALTISFAVGRAFGIWIAAYVKPHKLFYLCAGIMALGNVFMLVFANTAETLLWCSICLFGVGCGPMFPAIVSFYDDKISKVTNTVSGIFILGSMFNVALNSLIIGHYIIDNALILIVCNLVGSVLLMLLFSTLHMLTRVKKKQRVRKYKLQQQNNTNNNNTSNKTGGDLLLQQQQAGSKQQQQQDAQQQSAVNLVAAAASAAESAPLAIRIQAEADEVNDDDDDKQSNNINSSSNG